MFIPHAGSGMRSGSTDASGFFTSGTAGRAGSGLASRCATGADRENSWYTGASASVRGLPSAAADALTVTVGVGFGEEIAVAVADADADAVGEVVGGGGGSLMA